jgi:hypothetical protein
MVLLALRSVRDVRALLMEAWGRAALEHHPRNHRMGAV